MAKVDVTLVLTREQADVLYEYLENEGMMPYLIDTAPKRLLIVREVFNMLHDVVVNEGEED